MDPELHSRTGFDKAVALLQNPHAHASALLVVVADRFGSLDFTTWHPETVAAEVARVFGVPLPRTSFDRLIAAIAVSTTDAFFKQLDRFLQLACVLAGETVDPDELSLPTVAECAWAIAEALLLAPPDHEEADAYFADDVRAFIGQVLREEGFVVAPDVLKLAIDTDWADAAGAYSADPDLASGLYAVQRDKTAEVETVLREGLTELVQQLQGVPLLRGNVAELAKRLAVTARAEVVHETPGTARKA